MFKYPLRRIFKFAEMNDHCLHCGATFNPEPGFYYGAMFVSYAFTVAIVVTVGLALYFISDPPDIVYVIGITLGAILCTPFSFRYSRVLFLYWFGGHRYQGKR